MKILVSGLLDSDEPVSVQHVMMEQLLVMTIHPGWPLPSCGLVEPERAILVLFERLKHAVESTSSHKWPDKREPKVVASEVQLWARRNRPMRYRLRSHYQQDHTACRCRARYGQVLDVVFSRD